MRLQFVVLAASAALSLATAFAQTPPIANRDAPANPAIQTNDANKPGAPAAGANSFTEGQAKSRLEKDGYSDVSVLAKDADGLWRGKANKAGQTVDVAVDYQGNIVSR